MKEKTLGLIIFGLVAGVSYGSRYFSAYQMRSRRLREKEVQISSSSDPRRGGKLLFVTDEWEKVYSLDKEDRDVCHIDVINNYGETFLICWIDSSGRLHHFYPVNDGSIKDGSVSNRHREYTYVGDSFVLFKHNYKKIPENLSDIDPESLLCLYRPELGLHRHVLDVRRSEGWKLIRGPPVEVMCSYHPLESPGVAVDTSKKRYKKDKICGFKVMREPGVYETNPSLRRNLEEDLIKVCELLPSGACQKLRRSTRFWINESIVFGPASDPMTGRSCTYHSINGKEWLKANGLREDKSGGVEIYCAKDYLSSRGDWGTGGGLLHELAHAFHDKHCPGGFSCSEIQEAYNVAMSRRLYDKVKVHGAQGKNGPAKAYACTNCMEYFAELSVAFLWKQDEETEYNKWFPHNAAQLAKHDPNAFSTLNKFWGDRFPENA